VTTKTPSIVSSLLNTAERAIAEDRLPRAMALADRASALAPNDPAVEALVHKVTEGGHASRRRKIFAIAGAAILVAGGGTALGISMMHRSSPTVDAAVADAAIDAAIDAVDARDAAIDAPDAAIDASPDARIHDAKHTTNIIDAFVAAAPPAEASIDAHVVDAMVVEMGKITVVNDTWCDVSIDGEKREQILKPKTFEVKVGHHTVLCEQKGINSWTQEVEVGAGKTVTASGSMLGLVEVRIDADVSIGGVRFDRGVVTKLKPGRTRVVLGNTPIWIEIPRVPCRLHEDAGRVVCDP
jgi:hypothetical protein